MIQILIKSIFIKLQLIHVIGIAHFFLFFSFQLQEIWDDYFAPLDFQSHKFHHRDVGMMLVSHNNSHCQLHRRKEILVVRISDHYYHNYDNLHCYSRRSHSQYLG